MAKEPIDTPTYRELLVVYLYIQKYTLEEIGRMVGHIDNHRKSLNRERTRQILMRALRGLYYKGEKGKLSTWERNLYVKAEGQGEAYWRYREQMNPDLEKDIPQPKEYLEETYDQA